MPRGHENKRLGGLLPLDRVSETGFLVYRFYKAAYGRAPTYSEFLADTQTLQRDVVVGTSGWQAQLELNKQRFANAFVDRASFPSQWYNSLIANTGVTPSD